MGDTTQSVSALAKAEVLIEALPYLQRYAGRTFVVKYGGHAMGDPELARDFAADVVLLQSRFIDGLRVTDKATAEIAEMVLSGAINKELVGWIAGAGGKALGISGKDGGLVTARKVSRTVKDPDSNIESVIDLGFVGEPAQVDISIIETACAAGCAAAVSRSVRAIPTISTLIRWRARSPRRWARRGCSC